MRYAALLRGINVGGHIVKMDRLRTLFEAAGLSGVETFIASGNVVFESPKRSSDAIERAIEPRLQKGLGYPVATFVRSLPELTAIAERAPFGRVTLTPPGTLFVGFFRKAIARDKVRQLAALSNDVDTLTAEGREVYWLARGGFAESTISYTVVEKLLGNEATFRNANTVRRMVAKYCAP